MVKDISNKEEFIYPVGQYKGDFTPENVVFNANLQEFAQKVGLVCGLEANGKITPLDAYQKIKFLWDKLRESKENLLGEDQ
jgi:hypothetical protein